MRYPDDLTTEDVIDIFISKGLLEEEDIDDYLINEAEDTIYLRELENQERETQNKKDESERQQKRKEAAIKKEKKIKEIYPRSDKIIKDRETSNLLQFGALILILDYLILMILGLGLWALLPLPIYIYFILKAGSIRPEYNEYILAKDSIDWVKKKELHKLLEEDSMKDEGED